MHRRIAFRVDSSLQIGTGHVMRCLTLADALASEGFRCHFVCRDHPGNLFDRIRQGGHELTVLPQVDTVGPDQEISSGPPAHSAWLGCDWTVDAEQTRAALRGQVEWLVVDHYSLDARWEAALAGSCGRLMVIDDLADRMHACDLLLDQTAGRSADAYAALVPEACRVLVGARYALLRPEFAELRSFSLKRREAPRLERVLISMGGLDNLNVTGRILEVLEAESLLADCALTVVMGGKAPCLDAVKRQAMAMRREVDVQVDVRDMAALMADADFAIGSAGTTSWERCCLGLPSVVIVLAENQRLVAASLAALGAAFALENVEEISTRLPRVLNNLEHDPGSLSLMSKAAAGLVDGRGATQVAEFLRG
jgi:UDP-2,4-diacetamido-2,4,6-trideoxy-beta-L-altropyranose hydrolase